MQLPNLISATLIALLFTPTSILAAKAPKDAILLSNVKSLTLRANAKTSHRRVAAVPQLTCKGPGCRHYNVDLIRCTNQGSGYKTEDIEWSCLANLPDDFKLGSTDVQCEGYAHRDDEYVLKGSCALEYRLLLTEKGEEKYGSSFWGGSNKHSSGEESGTWASVLFVFIFLGVAIWILYSMWVAAAGQRVAGGRRPGVGGGWGGGWGGGGGGGDNGWDPPPPYPGKRYSTRANEGWQPGFWSGALGGAAAGYMAGNRGQRQQESTSSFFGNGGNRASSWGGGSSRASGSGSSSRHESTGFGSTSRR
ncbi:hypothetical protein HYALB_00003993 [Hymenoscyphus albidus]|uniref:Store-operated calcium entry-associated regulatory factor n=1 Tax=Hymenoscyphus albidus TaxID=595503 RepID=A0A9N9PZF5_9HELO|nr:hypothetical protein HYALB_00003993 [Hymenoscyphus albidus]